jgi:hypothetical protein
MSNLMFVSCPAAELSRPMRQEIASFVDELAYLEVAGKLAILSNI